MDTGKLTVVVSEKYRDDLKNIFQYGIDTYLPDSLCTKN